MGIVEQYLLQLNTEKRRWRRAVSILTALSLVVALFTTWNLRLTGITIANGASCGSGEHQHSDACFESGTLICSEDEHIHNTRCYSDLKGDVETSLDWRQMFDNYPYMDDLRTDLVGIAKTQVGYTESQLNFEVGDNGERRGYTRYGAWYGAPYGDWSAMFVSFCLNFARADDSEYPISSGATSMAELWKVKDKYIPVGEYVPQSGDIVFFDNNTVGIVTEVFNTAFFVIGGDIDGAVRSSVKFFGDTSIVGWGVTGEGSSGKNENSGSMASGANVLTSSSGPAFYLFDGDTSSMTSYTTRSTDEVIDLLPYLEKYGGSYFYTLLDKENRELPKDENGNYIAQANTEYNLTISFSSPLGFFPGTYQYQIPNGLMVTGGSDEFVLKDGTPVGYWKVTDTGLITLVFNENMNNRSDITVSSKLGIKFPESGTIDFDGFITVKVEPPVQQTDPTVLSKWGQGNTDSGKIYWTVRIDGHGDSQIPGNILTDQVDLQDWSRPHSYTPSDIAGGLTFGANDRNNTWHAWSVSPDDPRLIWDSNGWSYKIPHTVVCDICGELELGNEGWTYYINYTSTPTVLSTPGTFDYINTISLDGQTAGGWSNFTHGVLNAVISKSGTFTSDASGAGFVWEIQATIPGRAAGRRAEYSWFIMDEMRLFDENGINIGRLENDCHLSTVVATYNGTIIEIPNIRDATEDDLFAWDNAWTSTENGISHTRTINIVSRCRCTSETCHWTGCGNYWYKLDGKDVEAEGFCQCWTETQEMTFIFVYRSNNLSDLKGYGALGYKVNNYAQLYYMPDADTSVRVSYDDASVNIPNFFEKQLTTDFNGYTAHYRITLNEARAVLTNGSPLMIKDEMTDTLAFINGSLFITTENANGNTSKLQQGVDFSVTYYGDTGQPDGSNKKVHTLLIEIFNPQPVKYIIDYDTTLIMPDQVQGGIKYSNSASITLWGQTFSNSVDKVYADFIISANAFTVEMYKTCALTNKNLAGATFGLYNQMGGLIDTKATGENGRARFETSVKDGIVLQEHVLYYLQELQAPLSYRLDSTKHWFCFCSNSDKECETCNTLTQDVDAVRVPLGDVGNLYAVNHPANVELPKTGGRGTHIYILCGMALMIAPLVYGFNLKRKNKNHLRE